MTPVPLPRAPGALRSARSQALGANLIGCAPATLLLSVAKPLRRPPFYRSADGRFPAFFRV
jgi:hypothetical protein